ncbi:Peroxiredoxin-2-like protein [Aphelenchoides fujianensis]|nr:Peroxiredoxin-2-like protein [Aphelenchoides fujianensis]
MFQRAIVGQPAPEFEMESVFEEDFSEVTSAIYRGKYLVLLFYSRDFTPLCSSELTAFSARAAEFEAADCQLVGISTDSKYTHLAFVSTPPEDGGVGELRIPLLADHNHATARAFEVFNTAGHAERATFIIDPKGILRFSSVHDARVGRSVGETLRIVRALQHVDANNATTGPDWTE